MMIDMNGNVEATSSLNGSIMNAESLSGMIALPDILRGYSNYELAVQNGFEGTVEEYLRSLVGESVVIDIVENTPISYILSFSVGEESVITPNLIRGQVHCATTAEWNSHRDIVSEAGAIYIYLDASSYVDEHGHTVTYPSFKLGDGNAFLIDLPFGGDAEIIQHTTDKVAHITAQERSFWNNKVSIDESDVGNETLIFTVN